MFDFDQEEVTKPNVSEIKEKKQVQPEKEVIDISYDKIKEWMIGRRLLSSNWFENLKTIRGLKKQALEDLPDNKEIQEITQNREQELDYFDCKKILEILDKVEVKTTSFLGFGGNKRLKMWNYIIKLYEQENIYFAELSSKILQNVDYEISSKKQEISKSVTQLEELLKKEKDWNKNIEEYTKKFKQQCEDLHIKGENITEEISSLVSELKDWFGKIEKETNQDLIKKSVEYYTIYTQFVHGQKDSIPNLKYFLKNGNSSHYDWRKHFGKEVPKVDMEKLQEYQRKKEEKKEIVQEIDWSSLDQAPIESDVVDIKWEDNQVHEIKEIDIGFSMDDIEKVDSGKIEIDDSENFEKVIKMKQETLLENDESRYFFINDLIELEAFYSFKMKYTDQEIFLYTKNLPKEISLMTKEEIEKYHTSISQVLAICQDSKLKQLLMIKISKKFVERISLSLKQNLDFIEKMKKNISNSQEKKKNLENSIQELKPVIEAIVKETKNYQEFIEKNLSKLFDGREINIFGEINKI